MEVKVSVIVPVYNAERYLPACVESLLGQTLGACEFIFINDGSTDRSRQIIEAYQAKDKRIVLLNQTNQGVSSARNHGIRVAAGQYIGFVDADDTVELDMYERLYQAAVDASCDVVLSNVESELEGQMLVTAYPFATHRVLSRKDIEEDVLPYFLKAEDLNTACNKLYNKQLIDAYRIEFPAGVALGEDGMFNISFFSRANSMVYIDYIGYHYKEVAGSATRNIVEKDYFRRALEVYKQEAPMIYRELLGTSEIERLKSIKFINSVKSYIYIYLAAYREITSHRGYQYVKRMISHDEVQKALRVYEQECGHTLGRYEKLLLFMVKHQWMLGVYGLITYSKFRNQTQSKNGGVMA